MSPGALGSASGTAVPMMSMSWYTTPGVLALTDRPSAGRPSPARQATQPLSLPPAAERARAAGQAAGRAAESGSHVHPAAVVAPPGCPAAGVRVEREEAVPV